MAVSNILELPNEVLIQVLTPFTTNALLQSALVCTRFHNLVIRILHHRLALAASLHDHKIIFECFHPGHKNIEPYLFCDYLGTPGLSTPDNARDEPVYFETDGGSGFRRLGSLYSWFRPVPPEEMARLRRRHPASQDSQPGAPLQHHDDDDRNPWAPGRVLANEPKKAHAIDGAYQDVLANYLVNLDHDEGFTQLSMMTNLVKVGPRRGLFEQIAPISDQTTRLKRDWMRSVAASTLNVEAGIQKSEEDELRTLWVDDAKNIGLKVRMKEQSVQRTQQPLLYRESEPAISYLMEYDVLFIRTTRLLMAVEEALLQDRNDGSGKALIIGSFVSQVD